jgi:hypothetical protein
MPKTAIAINIPFFFFMRILNHFFFNLRDNAQDDNSDQRFQAKRPKICIVRLRFDSACLALLVLDELLPWFRV